MVGPVCGSLLSAEVSILAFEIFVRQVLHTNAATRHPCDSGRLRTLQSVYCVRISYKKLAYSLDTTVSVPGCPSIVDIGVVCHLILLCNGGVLCVGSVGPPAVSIPGAHGELV